LKNDIPQLVRKKGQGPLNNYAFWITGANDDPEVLRWVIWDRFYFSELAYGPIVRGKVRLTKHQGEVIESLLMANKPLIIHCRLIPKQELFEDRPQLFDWEVMERIDNYYSTVLDRWNVIHYEPGFTDYKWILEEVADYLIRSGGWLQFRRVCPYGRGNPDQPELMIVGERFGRNNPFKIPMERSKTGLMVHNALRANNLSMWDVWLTNALKYEGSLSTTNLHEMVAEYQLVKPKSVMALGRKAAGILTSLGIPCSKMNHPGYYMRQGREDSFHETFRLTLKF